MVKSGKARMGVIGLGMGKYHLLNYQKYERAEVVAICDMNETILKSVAKECHVSRTFTDIDEMLNSPLSLDVYLGMT